MTVHADAVQFLPPNPSPEPSFVNTPAAAELTATLEAVEGVPERLDGGGGWSKREDESAVGSRRVSEVVEGVPERPGGGRAVAVGSGAFEALATQRSRLLTAVEKCRYDQVATVRAAAAEVRSAVLRLPDSDPQNGLEGEDGGGSPVRSRGASSPSPQRRCTRLRSPLRIPATIISASTAATAASPSSRSFQHPRPAAGSLLDFGVQVFAPPSPPRRIPLPPPLQQQQQEEGGDLLDDTPLSSPGGVDQSPSYHHHHDNDNAALQTEAEAAAAAAATGVHSPGASSPPWLYRVHAGGEGGSPGGCVEVAHRFHGRVEIVCGSPAEIACMPPPGAAAAGGVQQYGVGSPLRMHGGAVQQAVVGDVVSQVMQQVMDGTGGGVHHLLGGVAAQQQQQQHGLDQQQLEAATAAAGSRVPSRASSVSGLAEALAVVRQASSRVGGLLQELSGGGVEGGGGGEHPSVHSTHQSAAGGTSGGRSSMGGHSADAAASGVIRDSLPQLNTLLGILQPTTVESEPASPMHQQQWGMAQQQQTQFQQLWEQQHIEQEPFDEEQQRLEEEQRAPQWQEDDPHQQQQEEEDERQWQRLQPLQEPQHQSLAADHASSGNLSQKPQHQNQQHHHQHQQLIRAGRENQPEDEPAAPVDLLPSEFDPLTPTLTDDDQLLMALSWRLQRIARGFGHPQGPPTPHSAAPVGPGGQVWCSAVSPGPDELSTLQRELAQHARQPLIGALLPLESEGGASSTGGGAAAAPLRWRAAASSAGGGSGGGGLSPAISLMLQQRWEEQEAARAWQECGERVEGVLRGSSVRSCGGGGGSSSQQHGAGSDQSSPMRRCWALQQEAAAAAAALRSSHNYQQQPQRPSSSAGPQSPT